MRKKDKPKTHRARIKSYLKTLIHTVITACSVILTLILVQAFASRNLPDLQPWHQSAPPSEFTADDYSDQYTFQQYLQQEQAVFNELAAYTFNPAQAIKHTKLSRFAQGGSQNPATQPQNWNRTQELIPTSTPKGGILLIHGLSDSPYSLRSIAEFFLAQDYYVLVVRMPAHGTVPAALLNVDWRDWQAAVQVAAQHVQNSIPPTTPFYIGGYSNGGALAVNYTLSQIQQNKKAPDHLFLFSPAIGITPWAKLARLDEIYGFIPYFEKSRWLSIGIEYDPYKYNSFTKNAGSQSWKLAQSIQARINALKANNQIQNIPPILTFQSIVDDTVRAQNLITGLYAELPPNQSEVVFFDVNHTSLLDQFISLDFSKKLQQLIQQPDLNYTVTRITNITTGSRTVHAQSRLPKANQIIEETLDLTWPVQVFSLAHVSIPFPPDDPLYGETPPTPPIYGLHIGSLAARGERHILKIPASRLIRIRHNPFHQEMMRRIKKILTSPTP